jgi:hypothetical protein
MGLQCLTLALPCLSLSFYHTLELRRLIAYAQRLKLGQLPERENRSEARRPTLPSHRVVEWQDWVS